MCSVALKIIFLAIFLLIIINESVTDFIFIKMPCFQNILMGTFRWMRLMYENYSLKRMLFQTFKQHSHCKNLIVKTFDEITVKMKSASPIQVKKKKYYFQLFLDKMCTLSLILRTCFFFFFFFLRAQLRVLENGRVEVNLSALL